MVEVEVAAAPAAVARVALVAGATGLVGREVLAVLLADKRYAKVLALGRRHLVEQHPKLVSLKVDFSSLPALPPVDDVYIALGTTIQVAGSKQAFRAVDFDAVLALARAAHQAGATRLAVVSAMGANPRSRVFYSRVKGEMEQALGTLGYRTLAIARPSVLAGNRAVLDQPTRIGELLGLAISTALKPLIPANYRAIQARDVAQALVGAVTEGRVGSRVILSGEMQPG